jgi:hypothetical protein
VPPNAGRQVVAGSHLKLGRPEDAERTFLRKSAPLFFSTYSAMKRLLCILVYDI